MPLLETRERLDWDWRERLERDRAMAGGQELEGARKIYIELNKIWGFNKVWGF